MKKQYGLWANLLFLLRQMKRYSRRSFRMIWLSIPMKVALPFIGILLPNLVVQAITEQGNVAGLMLAVLTLGLAVVLCSFLEQYAEGIMEEEQSKLCQALDDRLFVKQLNCDYENLENKEISGKFDEANEYIWQNNRYISQSAINLALLGSGAFGFLVYLSVLSSLPILLLLLMTACTVVSFLFSDLGDKERTKRGDYFGRDVRRISYLQNASADPKAGKDIRLYAMYPWIEEHFALTQIRPGERIALVGMNGAGKTTCVKLLCGLLEPTAGEIRINGVPSWKFNRQEYCRLFATVFQKIHPMVASIRENITCCPKGEEDQARLQQCLQLVDLYDRVQRLPKKEDTLLIKELDEEAVNLSGGEQQRLLLARALYKNAPVLVPDEPTAALDPIAEADIYSRFREMTDQKGALYISHRLSSCRFCDTIAVFHDGRLVQEGNHEELLSQEKGQYAQLWQAQAQWYQ